MSDTCPSCRDSGRMEVFYEARGIPAHSCVMLKDRHHARSFPTGDLALGFCRRCGLISNVLFDSALQDYSAGYEEQQSFSPRFREFQTDLIERLIARYAVRDKNIIEIGCGKGDFLVELCEKGGNRGMGIDPACDPGRMHERARGNVRFIAELYSGAHATLPCDFLCCRHTLEHIHDTGGFLSGIRSVLGQRNDVIVFFEVPAVERVLTDGAFWDVYYEHCSYFSLGSLARLFRSNRFEVLQLEKDFDDQYALIAARPGAGITEPVFDAEQDLEWLAARVANFREGAGRAIDAWKDRLNELGRRGKRVAIWGSGSKCVSFLCAMGLGDSDVAVVDINPYRQGRWLPASAIQVRSPDSLREVKPDAVFVMNSIYRGEIQRDLLAMGIAPELLNL